MFTSLLAGSVLGGCAAQVLKGLEPYLQHSLEVVDVLRREQRERMESLEHAITGFSQMKAARIADSAGASTSQATSTASARGPMHVASAHPCCWACSYIDRAAFVSHVCKTVRWSSLA